MAEEQKNPEEEQNTVEEVAEEVEATVEETTEAVEETVEDAAEEIEETIEDAAEEIEEVNEEVDEAAEEIGEEIQETAGEISPTLEDMADGRDHSPEGEREGSVEIASHAIEDVVEEEGHVDHHYSDEVVIPYFGHVGTMPGGIYTFIFLVLGAITVLEVAITLIGENALSITVLVLLSITKALLVIMYYMHLKDDNPLYRLVVILPLLIVLLSTLYLLGVPSGAGLGYN